MNPRPSRVPLALCCVAIVATLGGGGEASGQSIAPPRGAGPAAAAPAEHVDGAAASPLRQSASVAGRRRQASARAVSRVRSAIAQLQPLGGAGGIADGLASTPTTGLVLTPEGLIVSSSYGLDPRPASIVVTYDDGTRSSGKVLAIDYNRRLALVQASRGPRTAPAPLITAGQPRVGQTAIALGRTFRTDEPNVSVGIVSATRRLYGRAVQTDAAVSPANYGGPLIDLQGRVIGVLTPLAPASDGPDAGPGWYDSGIGFAVPLPQVLQRIDRLRQGESIRRGLWGVAFQRGSDYTAAPKLLTVHPGGPADAAGLKAGDVIREVDGTSIATVAEFRHAADAMDDGQTVSARVTRGEQLLTSELTLAAELE
ncbi:MAG: trypsin-like peptidase domain-containing protein, partial [Planctomycetota bacterium]